MKRTVLSDTDWTQLLPLLPRRGPKAKRRQRLEDVLWIHRTGAPWRDLPARPRGRWVNARRCFERWTKSGLLERLFARLRELHGADTEAIYLDSTTAKAHRHAAGARKSLGPQAIGASRGGRGTKVHAVCDALGYPLAVKLSAAQEADVSHAEALLEDQPAQRVVADRGYDADALREHVKAKGAEPCIPGRKNRKVAPAYDAHWYKSRHLIENFFCRIKDHRRVATRYEKCACYSLAMVTLSCILVWLQM